MERVLAFDVGGTKLAVGIVDANGAIEGLRHEPTVGGQGPQELINRLIELGRGAVRESSHPIRAAGIGCGGPLDQRGGVVLAPLWLPGWDRVPLVQLIAEAFGLPTFLDNDATAAAWAEYCWGGWDVDDLIYLTISTGMGGGVVLGGALRRGAAGNGGELGHLVVDWNGRRCECGQQGCAEAYVSGTAIARRATEAASDDKKSPLSRLARITAHDVAEAAACGDPLARRVWDETTAILGRFVASIVNVFEPEIVVLGGGVTNAGAILIDPVREAALRQALPPAAQAVRIELSAHGPYAGVLGAGAIAFDRLREL